MAMKCAWTLGLVMLVVATSGAEEVLAGTIAAHSVDAWRVRFSGDGKLLATAGSKADSLKVWDVRTQKLVQDFGKPEQGFFVMSFLTDGKTVLTSS